MPEARQTQEERMTSEETIAAFKKHETPPVYRFAVGPTIFEHDPVTGRTVKVAKRPLTEDGKTWTKTEEGWIRQ